MLMLELVCVLQCKPSCTSVGLNFQESMPSTHCILSSLIAFMFVKCVLLLSMIQGVVKYRYFTTPWYDHILVSEETVQLIVLVCSPHCMPTGPKSLKKYKRLMMNRINWDEARRNMDKNLRSDNSDQPNQCSVVWEVSPCVARDPRAGFEPSTPVFPRQCPTD